MTISPNVHGFVTRSGSNLTPYDKDLPKGSEGYSIFTAGLGGAGDNGTAQLTSSQLRDDKFYLKSDEKDSNTMFNAEPLSVEYKKKSYTVHSGNSLQVSWDNKKQEMTGDFGGLDVYTGIVEFDQVDRAGGENTSKGYSDKFNGVKDRKSFNDAFSKVKEISSLNDEAVFALCALYGNVHISENGKFYRQPSDDSMGNEKVKYWEEVTDQKEKELLQKAFELLKIKVPEKPEETAPLGLPEETGSAPDDVEPSSEPTSEPPSNPSGDSSGSGAAPAASRSLVSRPEPASTSEATETTATVNEVNINCLGYMDYTTCQDILEIVKTVESISVLKDKLKPFGFDDTIIDEFINDNKKGVLKDLPES